MVRPIVRAARAEDVSGIRRVARRTWHATYDGILNAETIDRALDTWYDPDTVRRQVTDDETAYLVAAAAREAESAESTPDQPVSADSAPDESESGDSIVGYVAGGPAETAETAHLGAIYVEPDRQGTGLGGRLLGAFEDRWQRRGRSWLRIRVLADNERAIGFYRTHGYEIRERAEIELFGGRVAEVRMAGRITNDE